MILRALLCCGLSGSNDTIFDTDGVSEHNPRDTKVKAKDIPAPAKPEPYSAARAEKLFTTYADVDDPSFIGAEGFEQLCTDADISMEGALPMLLAWQMDATEMAKITKEQWSQGMDVLQISSLPTLAIALNDLNDLLILSKTPLKPAARPTSSLAGKVKKPGDEGDPYNRKRYHEYARDTKKAFGSLYQFCFTLAKPENSRNIDMETATALWTVLLVPKYPLMGDIVDFITEAGSYKGVNKDLWHMMLEFCQTISPNLDNYDENEGAWPTLLDEFVSWRNGPVGTSS
ncbi:DUF298-domain-containing protein [Stereum hirsutum FP-91666 SS1]|uniref:DUF298-domain-containing protein n=1 Tax=Stereum hirsutum (strain FP-91666) TaxID=721885 RepID=UPI000440E72A|nr:DUF298-domain-containing protein [Stereum hirsutum FP-91666 SS1]EIM90283.1 DUF298-domain-containing protein [Stereum hirsutum FP-91666 SS1]